MMKNTSDNATWDAAGDKGKEKIVTVKKKKNKLHVLIHA